MLLLGCLVDVLGVWFMVCDVQGPHDLCLLICVVVAPCC